MKTYDVGISEHHIRWVRVEAETEQEAMNLANTHGELIDMEYVTDFDQDEWEVEEVDE